MPMSEYPWFLEEGRQMHAALLHKFRALGGLEQARMVELAGDLGELYSLSFQLQYLLDTLLKSDETKYDDLSDLIVWLGSVMEEATETYQNSRPVLDEVLAMLDRRQDEPVHLPPDEPHRA